MPIPYQYSRASQYFGESIANRHIRKAKGLMQLAAVARAQTPNLIRAATAAAGSQKRRLSQSSFSSKRHKKEMPPMKNVPPTPARSRSRGRAAARSLSVRDTSMRSRSSARSAKSVRVRVSAPSRSTGFVKTKKGVSNPFNAYLKKGLVQATEHGGVLNSWNPADPVTTPSAQVLYVGHTTACPEAYRVIIAQAIMKKLLVNAKLKCDDFTQVLAPSTGTQALQLRLFSRTAAADTNSPDSVDPVSWNVLTETINSRCTLLADLLFPSDTTDQRIFTNLILLGVIGTTFVPLANVDMQSLKVHFHVKSALKIQNRTVSLAENDTAEDVDNVPLYGRSYAGTGNGAVYRGTYPTSGTVGRIPLTANDSEWHIAPAPQTTLGTRANLWLEPPFQKEFLGVKESGKIHLEPGEIKTSVLNHKQSISFARIYNMLYMGTTSPSAGWRFMFGKYRFFCMEKMIQAVATSAAGSIKVAYEVDCKMGCYVTEHRSFATRMQVVLNPN